ncbi:unnamed protein product [Ectocarpus fasciculatus]
MLQTYMLRTRVDATAVATPTYTCTVHPTTPRPSRRPKTLGNNAKMIHQKQGTLMKERQVFHARDVILFGSSRMRLTQNEWPYTKLIPIHSLFLLACITTTNSFDQNLIQRTHLRLTYDGPTPARKYTQSTTIDPLSCKIY